MAATTLSRLTVVSFFDPQKGLYRASSIKQIYTFGKKSSLHLTNGSKPIVPSWSIRYHPSKALADRFIETVNRGLQGGIKCTN